MIFETSWEVCNKMGGIYTVLSTRARQMTLHHGNEVIFIGPLTSVAGAPHFIHQIPKWLTEWQAKAEKELNLPIRIGRWDIPGKPAVVLVDFKPLWNEKGALYYEMWQHYGLKSDRGYGDYDEASLFGIAAARVMHSLFTYFSTSVQEPFYAIFNEWQTGMGLLYSQIHCPALHTLFITHATTVGRSIAGNGKVLYAYMSGYNGNQMSQELNVEAKHNVEKCTAHQADCFATVSELTRLECRQLLERDPVVLPNGFEPGFVPTGQAYEEARQSARRLLVQVADTLGGQHTEPKEAFLMAIGGRYEYRNKGIDLYLQALAEVNRTAENRMCPIIAFLFVPAWVAAPRTDLQYRLTHPEPHSAMQHPSLSHWIHEMDRDAVMTELHRLGLDAVTFPSVRVIFVPCYLNGQDGIFNKTYYQLLVGMDLTVFPSYYEPWGYTPLESIAFGVPTITTNLSGFGLWVTQSEEEHNHDTPHAVEVVMRNDHQDDAAIHEIVTHILNYASGKYGSARELREHAQTLAERAEWVHFYENYLHAYEIARHRKN